MVKNTSEIVITESELLPKRLYNEWRKVCGYYSRRSDLEIWNDFKSTWDVNSISVKEILAVSDTVNQEWVYWRMKNNIYYEIKDLSSIWNSFKKEWQFDSDETKRVFEEMSKLSDHMLNEWRYKYNYTYTHVYEDRWTNNVDYNKSKSKLWDEFKEIWQLDFDNYNEDEYKRMRDSIESGDYDDQAWFNFRENANYHSFDSYSIREQYDIWYDFLSSGCKDPYRNSDDESSDDES